jgi:hypothetical protein
MNCKENGILERLAALSLERCLVKLSKVSAGTWQLAGTAGSRGTLADAVGQYNFNGRTSAAVYIDVKDGISLSSLLLFDPEDMDCISKCFLGYSFPRIGSVSHSEEVMLLELGNVLLNSLCNSILNALRTSGIPSVPRYIQGDRRAILATLGAVMDPAQKFRTIAVTLAMQSGTSVSKCKVFALLPEDVAAGLEGMVSGE